MSEGNLKCSRRHVLRLAGVGAISLSLPSISHAEEPGKKIPIGLELYSVRVQLPKDFAGVIEAIGKMGYEGVEFAGYCRWDRKPHELRKLLDDNGLKCCGTHTPLPTLEGDELKKTIELHQILGNKFLICPNLPGDSAVAWEDNAKKFNDIAARAKESGMLVGYHSHAQDFKKYDGKTAWEIFFDNTNPDVVHQLDVGNTIEGGGDPIALIRKYPGRSKTTHLKEHGGAPDAPIGEGTVDWKPLLETYESVGGIEWYIVEHETSSHPLKTIKECLDNLHKMDADPQSRGGKQQVLWIVGLLKNSVPKLPDRAVRDRRNKLTRNLNATPPMFALPIAGRIGGCWAFLHFWLLAPALLSSPLMNPKQRAAEAAMEHIHDGMVIGLGTGTTADFFLVALGSALRSGRLRNIVGVATSRQSEGRAIELGIPLTTLAQSPLLDLTVDGADEVDPQLDLIKGLGGALLREKIVAQNSKKLIVIADSSKAVRTLGTKSPLPVEVSQFAYETQLTFLVGVGAKATLRRNADGDIFVTDNGNFIYDCRFAAIDDPSGLSKSLRERAGIVECGLFLGMASLALIAGEKEVQVLRRGD